MLHDFTYIDSIKVARNHPCTKVDSTLSITNERDSFLREKGKKGRG